MALVAKLRARAAMMQGASKMQGGGGGHRGSRESKEARTEGPEHTDPFGKESDSFGKESCNKVASVMDPQMLSFRFTGRAGQLEHKLPPQAPMQT